MVRMEKEGAGRWLVTHAGIRVGVVMGGNGVYQAQRGNGQFVGNAKTRKDAADLLVSAQGEKQ